MSPSFMGKSERKALTFCDFLVPLKVMPPSRYWSPSSIGMVMSTALPGPFINSGI